MSEFLIERWCQALPADCGSAAAQAAGAELVARWSEPARRYHTVDHLTFMLTVLDEAADLADDIHAVRLAAWFHDAVYDPRVAEPTGNEQASAELAAAMLPPLAVPPAQVDEVVRLVLLTADHARRAGRSQRRPARRRRSRDPGRRRRALRGLRRRGPGRVLRSFPTTRSWPGGPPYWRSFWVLTRFTTWRRIAQAWQERGAREPDRASSTTLRA